jgi:aryl-alcohol dehydrogenase-like predicted oxidoreductase
MVNYRFLGSSGLKITELVYGNWITHGLQVENDTATRCVHAALDAGITSFDTADAYANGVAEEVLGAALKGQRRESLEVFTKVYWPTGPGGPNDTGLSRKHIMESIDGSLRRLGMDYVDLYQAHRFDTQTPLEETMVAFADVVRQGKALYIGVSEWTAEQIRAGAALAKELRIPFVSNQPQYSALYRVIEEEVVPASREVGISQIVFSPVAQGVLTGKYKPGEARPPGRVRPTRRAARTSSRASSTTRPCSRRCSASCRSPPTSASHPPSSRSRGCSRTTTWPLRSSAPRGPSRSPRTSRPRACFSSRR